MLATAMFRAATPTRRDRDENRLTALTTAATIMMYTDVNSIHSFNDGESFVTGVSFEKPGSPTERRERNRREMTDAILSAARVIMRRDGVAALNLHEIARMVGVRTPALYRYFPSKAAIYDELFRRGMSDVHELFEELYRAYPPSWERLRAWAEARLVFAQRNPDLDHLLFGRDVPGFTPSDESMAVSRARYAGAVRAMQETIDAGVIAPGVPVERALDLFLTVTSGIASQHMANQPDLPAGQGRFGSLIPDALRLFKAAWTPGSGLPDEHPGRENVDVSDGSERGGDHDA